MTVFTLVVLSGNAAFDDDPVAAVVSILENTITQLNAGRCDALIQDVNGNTVGSWDLNTRKE